MLGILQHWGSKGNRARRRAKRSPGSLFLDERLEPIFRGRLGCGNLVERGEETFAAGAPGHLPHAGPAGQLLGQRRGYYPFHGNLLPRRQFGHLPVHGVRNCHVEGHGVSPIMARNSRGVITRMPKRSAPAKSLALKVSRKSALLSPPRSTTKSHLGSGSSGRQRKKMGRRLALADRKCRMSSTSLSPRDSPAQTRFNVCSYSRTSGTERFIRQRSSPTIRSTRCEAPRLERSAATSTLVSTTTWYMVQSQHTPQGKDRSARRAGLSPG